jgi:hypothetical protein
LRIGPKDAAAPRLGLARAIVYDGCMSRKSDTWILILFIAAIWAAPAVICWRKGIAKDDDFQIACIIAAPFIIPRIVAWHSRWRGKTVQSTAPSPRRDEPMNRAEVCSICLIGLGTAIASNSSSIAAYNHVALSPTCFHGNTFRFSISTTSRYSRSLRSGAHSFRPGPIMGCSVVQRGVASRFRGPAIFPATPPLNVRYFASTVRWQHAFC